MRNLLFAAGLTISINGCAGGGGGTEGLNRAIKREAADAGTRVAAFYRTQGFQPIWIRGGALTPQATEALRLLASARDDGLEPARYRVDGLPRANAGASDLAEAEVGLSAALARYAEDLHRPPRAMVFTDPGARPPTITESDILSGLARTPDPRAYLLNLRRMNPLYESLRDGFRRYRAEWMTLPDVSVATGPTLSEGMAGERVAALRKRLGFPAPGGFDADVARKLRSFQLIHGLPVNGRADSATVAALNRGPSGYEQVIRANLDRLRGLPASLSPRAIVVDARSAELTYFDGGKPAGIMRVIVGRVDQQTPTMAGMLRFVVLRPYWNVPPDIVRNRFAPDVLREGDRILDEHQMEVLADWSEGASAIDPKQVDWQSVATGNQMLRMRQLPGPQNMMGSIKFMMPNRLGIYLHDTPKKALFLETDRRLSSGCVRLENPRRLARWLFGGRIPVATSADQHADLPAPVPVYIIYRTVLPAAGSVKFTPDPYERDPVSKSL